MFLSFLELIFGLALLIKGADVFVESAVRIAEKLKVSELIIGLTLVSVGTSLPELAASVLATYRGTPGLAVGNVVGSNIANIGLILGLSAVILHFKTNERILKRDGYIMMFASVLAYAFLVDRVITRGEGFFLFLFFVAYMVFLFEEKPKYYGLQSFIVYFFKLEYLKTIGRAGRPRDREDREKGKGYTRDIVLLMVGVIGVVYGADFTVKGAVALATELGIPDTIIGLTVIAFGTSLPELGVSLSAARKKRGAILVGNILGSNTSNILLILGVSSMINPVTVTGLTLYYSLPYMLLISLLLLLFLRTDWRIKKSEGAILFNFYLFFLVGLFAYLVFL